MAVDKGWQCIVLLMASGDIAGAANFLVFFDLTLLTLRLIKV
jgi:hypothetical protein